MLPNMQIGPLVPMTPLHPAMAMFQDPIVDQTDDVLESFMKKVFGADLPSLTDEPQPSVG